MQDLSATGDNARLHDLQETESEPWFTARVRKVFVAGNPSNEFENAVALKRGIIVMRRSSNAPADSEERKKFTGPLSRFPVSSCIKITPWRSVQKTGNVAMHFEKIDNILLESKEVLNARRAGKLGNSRSSTRTARTKVTIISVRGWSLEDALAVQQIWETLNYAAVQNQSRKTVDRPKVGSDRVTLRHSVIDEKTRLKERRRYSEDRRLLANVPRSSTARLTQGQKMMKALSKSSQQRGGRYSALARGATGRQSFSDSLIGTPNLKDFEKPITKPQRDPGTGTHHIGNASTHRSRQYTSQGASVFSGTQEPIDIDNQPTSSQPAGKRQREQATSADVAAKRQKYLSQQLKRHKASAQAAPARRLLRSSLQSLPTRSSSSDAVPASGIANDGNTCYLSAVVQAFMCDKDLMIRIGRRTDLGSSSMPFSTALATMSKSRESLKTLKAGLIRQAVSKHFPQFSSSDQQDAHEFFLRCLDVVAKECTLSDFRDSPTHTDYSLVQERKFTCTSCGHQTKPRREILRGLSLDIPQETEHSCDAWECPPLSVQDLVGGFFASQDLVLDCESCDGKNANSDTKIVLTPRSLVLHIKRFGLDYHGKNGDVSIKKISDPVKIPERISLDTVLAHNATSSAITDPGSKRHWFNVQGLRNATPNAIDESEKLFSLSPSQTPDISTSPPKTQGLSQITQLLSPSETDVAKRPRTGRQPFNLARYRVHAGEPTNNRLSDSAGTTVPERSKCRPLQVDRDEIQDDNNASEESQPLDRRSESDGHVKAIMALGISEDAARKILREANHDITRAMGFALDKRQHLRENPKDLNEDLLNYISRIEKHPGVDGQTETARYKLAAVIRHHSDTTDRGHYVVDVLQPDGSWFCYDDSSVFKLNSTELQAQEGYLCWYIAD